jgi:3',5'-cyclic AMP phosphodiesterase CpdA
MLAQFESILYRIGAFILALISTFSSLLGMRGGGIPKEAATEDTLCMTIAAISDTHVGKDAIGAAFLTPGMRDISDPSLDVDAVLFLGDNTDNGNVDNWEVFTKSVTANCKVKNKIILLGNHDTWISYDTPHVYEEGLKNYLHYSNLIMGTNNTLPYFTRVFNGYWFICLAQEDTSVSATVSDTQLNWLEEQLRLAAADGNGKPIFVLLHQPMNYTHAVGDNLNNNGINDGQSEKLQAILDRYENVFYFSGHQHYGLNDGTDQIPAGFSTVEQVGKNITSVNFPAFGRGSYFDGGDPLIGDGLIINVYADRIEFLGRNFVEGGWLDFNQNVYFKGVCE